MRSGYVDDPSLRVIEAVAEGTIPVKAQGSTYTVESDYANPDGEGPEVNVVVPGNGLILLQAHAELKALSAGNDGGLFATVFDDLDLVAGGRVIEYTDDDTDGFVQRHGTMQDAGGRLPGATQVTFFQVTPGPHRFRLKYGSFGNGDQFFRNRKLRIGVFK